MNTNACELRIAGTARTPLVSLKIALVSYIPRFKAISRFSGFPAPGRGQIHMDEAVCPIRTYLANFLEG
jgi:hypothetical protein